MTKRKKQGSSSRGWQVAACFALGTVVIVLSVVGGLGLFSSKGGSSGPQIPFYNDSSLMVCWYPLESDYIDTTTKTSARLLNSTSSSCTPSFQSDTTLPDGSTGSAWLNPCAGVRQGLIVPAALWPTDFTVSVWVRLSLEKQYIVLVGSSQSQDNDFDNTVALYGDELDITVGGGLAIAVQHVTLQIGVWYHVAVAPDTGVYVNGVALAGSFYRGADTTVPLVIGNDINLSDYDNTLVGNIMGLRLFNVGLNSTQIQTLYELKGK